MKALLLAFLFFSAGCHGQPKESVKFKPSKLVKPNPWPKDWNSLAVFQNCIILLYTDFMTIHKGTENDFADLNSLSKHLKKNAALFRKERLYVIVDSTTQPEKTAVILELLNDQKIDNYKVLNLIEYLTPPKPEPTDVAVNDSSYLSIRVIDSGFVITLLDKKQVVKNLREIDNFITANKPLINPRKIKIIAPGNTPYEKWGPALEALAKHEYYGYKLVSE